MTFCILQLQLHKTNQLRAATKRREEEEEEEEEEEKGGDNPFSSITAVHPRDDRGNGQETKVFRLLPLTTLNPLTHTHKHTPYGDDGGDDSNSVN